MIQTELETAHDYFGTYFVETYPREIATFMEIWRHRENMFVSPKDVTATTKQQTLECGDECRALASIPTDHFVGIGCGFSYNELKAFTKCLSQLRCYSIKSKYAQAGMEMGFPTVELPDRTCELEGAVGLYVQLSNINPRSKFFFSDRQDLPLFRFYLPPYQMGERGANLLELARKLCPEDKERIDLVDRRGKRAQLAKAENLSTQDRKMDPESDEAFIKVRLPIVRWSYVWNQGVFVDELSKPMPRKVLDEKLWVRWNNISWEMHHSPVEYLLGETLPVEMDSMAGHISLRPVDITPRRFHLHSASPLIDSGFRGPIRTESQVFNMDIDLLDKPDAIELYLCRS